MRGLTGVEEWRMCWILEPVPQPTTHVLIYLQSHTKCHGPSTTWPALLLWGRKTPITSPRSSLRRQLNCDWLLQNLQIIVFMGLLHDSPFIINLGSFKKHSNNNLGLYCIAPYFLWRGCVSATAFVKTTFGSPQELRVIIQAAHTEEEGQPFRKAIRGIGTEWTNTSRNAQLSSPLKRNVIIPVYNNYFVTSTKPDRTFILAYEEYIHVRTFYIHILVSGDLHPKALRLRPHSRVKGG